MRIVALDKESKQSILNDLLKRSPNNYSQYESTVNQIIDRVRAEGDKALFDYTLQFDMLHVIYILRFELSYHSYR